MMYNSTDKLYCSECMFFSPLGVCSQLDILYTPIPPRYDHTKYALNISKLKLSPLFPPFLSCKGICFVRSLPNTHNHHLCRGFCVNVLLQYIFLYPASHTSTMIIISVPSDTTSLFNFCVLNCL
jgi:hypothetical protein